MFEIDANDWYVATVITNLPDRHILFASLNNGETVAIPHDWHVITHSPGMHFCYLGLPQDTEVKVRIAPNDRHRSAEYRALELVCIDAPLNREEVGTVKFWNRNHGSIARDCGCSIMGLSPSQEAPIELCRGDRVSFGVRSNSRKHWVAFGIKLAVADSKDETQ